VVELCAGVCHLGLAERCECFGGEGVLVVGEEGVVVVEVFDV